ncbi:hypothetical protein IU427_11150 [Nocardia beijingensis]|uniref:hypothetical protein n=1 Tax=Nocardia beijingensis TaxID=95162 RepID=UPI001895E3A7|nr:hypothetical protein [Nocardia beijingensis]MBF6465727.1 hypothetical protein [Nocardia beijingensis]
MRSATDDLEVDLVAKPGRALPIPGRLAALSLWVRSPHASIRVSARLRGTGQSERELVLGSVPAIGEWRRLRHEPADPVDDGEVVALTIRLTQVVKQEGRS